MSTIAVDPDGSLWFGTSASGINYGGLSHYTPGGNPEWETFTADALGHNYGGGNIAIGIDGSLWFGNIWGGVSHFTPGGNPEWETFTTADGLAGSLVLTIFADADGSLWFGTYSAGVSHFTPGGNPEWETFTAANGLADNRVQAIFADADGSLWFGTSGGLSHYMPGETPEWETFTAFDGLIYNNVVGIARDTDGSLWFGTPGGLSHYIPGNYPEWETFTSAGGLASNDVGDIFVDTNGSLWFSSEGTVGRYTPGGNPEWETFTAAEGGASTIIPSPDGSLWFGTTGGVKHYTPGGTPEWETFTIADGLTSDGVLAIAVHPDNSLWFGTNEGGVSHFIPGGTPEWETFTTADGLTSNYIRSIAVGIDGSLWFGTEEGGVSHYTPGGSPEWESFTTIDGLLSNDVQAIAIGTDGSLWFGTWWAGVSHYTPGGNPEWESFSTAGGVPLNGLWAMITDRDGSLWIGSYNGLSHYTMGGNPEWETFTSADGLPTDQVRAIAIHSDSLLWVGTYGGLTQWVSTIQQSDLSVQLEGPVSVLAGQPFNYTLQITNNGQRDAANTVLTTTLPLSATYLEANIPPASTLPLTWPLGTLAANNPPVTLVVTGTLLPGVLPGTTITTTASAATTSPETFLSNNMTQAYTTVRDPDRADIRVSLTGPPLLVPSSEASYSLLVDNIGGLAADNTTLTLDLPSELSFQSANLPPSSFNPLIWNLGNLPPDGLPLRLDLAVNVAGTAPPNTDLTVWATVTTVTPDSDPTNNAAVSTIATSLTDALTLILIASDRLIDRYGASPLLSKLYLLADHPQVRGVVLDMFREPGIQATYAAWDADPGNPAKANAVAETIKTLIDNYTITYPNLRYLVFVGGDDLIPFYRVTDQNDTIWHERNYHAYLPPGTVRAALSADKLLTDDFYADRSPTVPDSLFWTDGHHLYLPDFATGRLVETPEEMMTVIDAFLDANGEITLGPGVIGTDAQLTGDLGQAQCNLFQDDSLETATCTTNANQFRQAVLAQPAGSVWAAPHSNHFSLGLLSATDILNRSPSYDQTILVTIGCHAGLNVPAPTSSLPPALDLVQTFLGQGGTYIGSLNYTYASRIGLGLSEALARELTQQLLTGQSQELGPALVRAKQAYYAGHGWFNYTDEKVLLPVTLYGLPMLRVTTPDSFQISSVGPSSAQFQPTVAELGSLTVVTYTLGGLSFTEHTGNDGIYYDYEDQVIAQDLLPVQPALELSLSSVQDGQTVKGVRLHAASYTDLVSFDPLIAQSGILGQAQVETLAEPPVMLTGWDRELPYNLGYFDGLLRRETNLNLVLGAYDGTQEIERLFDSLVLEVLYSDSPDRVKPVILSSQAEPGEQSTSLRVSASDDAGVADITLVYDDSQGRWQSLALTPAGGQAWDGQVSEPATRFYVQVTDVNGNVTTGPWQTVGGDQAVYLPVILHHHAGATPANQAHNLDDEKLKGPIYLPIIQK